MNLLRPDTQADALAAQRALGLGALNEFANQNARANLTLKDYHNNYEGIILAREFRTVYGRDGTTEQWASFVAERVITASQQQSSQNSRFVFDSRTDYRTTPVEQADGSIRFPNYDVNRLPGHELVPLLGPPDAVRDAFPQIYPQERTPCFLAGTPILMANGREKPIEDIVIGDLVMAFDATADQGRGALVPRPVTRLYRDVTKSIIDLRGLRITAGHICLTDEGRFESVAEILLRDGKLLHADGSAIRARTGAKIGSVEDTPIRVCLADQTSGTPYFVTLRAGIPLLSGAEHASSGAQSFAVYLAENGVSIAADGSLSHRDGSLLEAAQWPVGSTPFDKPMQRDWIIRDTADQPFIPDYVAELLNSVAVEAEARGDARHVVRSKAASGSLILAAEEPTFTRSLFHEFSEVSKDLFERGSEWGFGTFGAIALAPQQKDGWCTYNFEVKGLHTYVAGSLRVHNRCDGTVDPESIHAAFSEDGAELRIEFDYEDGSQAEVVNRFDLNSEEADLQSVTTVFRSADGQVDIAQESYDGEAQYYRAVSGNDGRPTLVAIDREDFSAEDTSRNQPALDIEAYEINANQDGSGFEFTGTDARGATLSVEIDPGAGNGSSFYRTEEV
ncbi:MAG: hypothetical protein ING16_14085, partial [Roseomonas sp.]|nr:hypothetical protein [Roseomonas sp.]